jgi:hypothetical protein
MKSMYQFVWLIVPTMCRVWMKEVGLTEETFKSVECPGSHESMFYIMLSLLSVRLSMAYVNRKTLPRSYVTLPLTQGR